MRVIVVALLLFISYSAAKAQLFIDECNPMIKSLEDVVYIVRQDFALQDEEDNLFGQNGNNFFGYAIGPGVMVDGELIYSNFTRKPFLSDTAYKDYGEGYTPVSTGIYFKKLDGNEMTSVAEEADENISFVSIPLADSAYIVEQSGLAVKDSMKCVVVTFLAKNKKNLEKSHYKLSYLHNSVTWQDNTGKLTNTALGSDAVFGLVFYEKVGHGQVNYVLGGFVERIKNEWTVTKYQKLKPLNNSSANDKDKEKGKRKK